MMKIVLFFVLLAQMCTADSSDENTIYGFNAKLSNGTEISFEKYRGKVLIVVNVASECGLTEKNYVQMKEILDKYKSQGLEIALFPSNQFGGQEPQSDAEIQKFVNIKYKFEPDLFAKIDVNGENQHPIYKFLKEQQPGTLTDAIKWNFSKFLINRKGHAIERYAPTTSPNSMIEDIEKALADTA